VTVTELIIEVTTLLAAADPSLFAALGSVEALEAKAMFVIVPIDEGAFTLTVSIRLEPGAKGPKVGQERVRLESVALLEAYTNVAPEGSESLSAMKKAESGPEFVTVR
jgi:hypothetical protein